MGQNRKYFAQDFDVVSAVARQRIERTKRERERKKEDPENIRRQVLSRREIRASHRLI